MYSTMTIDGRIASKTGFSRLSCMYDLRRLHTVRAESDAVIVGANTVIVDDPLLTVRYVKGKNPTRVIIDGMLRTSVNARVYNTLDEAPTIVYTSKIANSHKKLLLKAKGVEVVEITEKPPLKAKDILRDLYHRGVRKVLIEGGGKTIWSFIKDKLVDEMRITISPYVFGNGTSIVDGEGFRDDKDAIRFKLVEVKICECGMEVHLRYVRV